jgi:hypothetical protein
MISATHFRVLSVRAVAAALLAMALVPIATRAFADPLAAGIAAMPPDVEDVRVVGSWAMPEGKTGVYRLIVARSGTQTVTARLFLQWISYPASAPAGEIVAGVEISELRDLAVNVLDYRIETGPNELVVFLTLSKPGEAEREYELIVRAADDYKFRPQSN